jgi:hypothetical protein
MASTLMSKLVPKEDKKIRWFNITALFIFVYYLACRAWFIWQYGDRAFGYDTGIYRRLIIDNFQQIGNPEITPFGFAYFTNVLSLLGAGVDQILFFWYMLFSAMIFAAIWVLARVYLSRPAALLALFFFATSIVQFEFFWSYYYRNFVALFLAILIILAIKKKSYVILLLLVALGTIHPVSLVPVGLLMIAGLTIKKYRKYLFLTGLLPLVVIVALNRQELAIYLSVLQRTDIFLNYLEVTGFGEMTGQFINLPTYLVFGFYYIFFGIAGLIVNFKKIKLLSIFAIVNIFLIAVGFVFYRRFYVFLDIALIIFSAQFLAHYWQKINFHWLSRLILIIFFGSIIWQSAFYCFSKEPLISSGEMTAIDQLNNYQPAYLISASSYYAPWLYGYTHHRVIAPGMLDENLWNKEQWNIFWKTASSTERYRLVEQYYETPLYLFTGKKDDFFKPRLEVDERFIKINDYLWELP